MTQLWEIVHQHCSTMFNYVELFSIFLNLNIGLLGSNLPNVAQLCSALLNFDQLCSTLLNFVQFCSTLCSYAQILCLFKGCLLYKGVPYTGCPTKKFTSFEQQFLGPLKLPRNCSILKTNLVLVKTCFGVIFTTSQGVYGHFPCCRPRTRVPP